MSSTSPTYCDDVRVASSVFIIAQSDTRKRECLICWLQKKVLRTSLKRLLFEWGTFSEFLRISTFWKELAFSNFKGPYQETSSQHLSMFRYCVWAIRNHPESKEKFVEIAAAAVCYLRILTGKKHPKIKPQRLQKIRIWTFGSLVHQINSY